MDITQMHSFFGQRKVLVALVQCLCLDSILCLLVQTNSLTPASTDLLLHHHSFLATKSKTTTEDATDPLPHLIFPGGGLFFYWQAGAVTYLRENGYDLSSLSMSGASAGALTATLTACEIDFCEATNLALNLAEESLIWDRSSGLQGIWGSMIETWLYDLLPSDALTKLDNHRLSLLVTPLQVPIRKVRIDSFESIQDLVQCNMVSAHLPWFLDGKLSRSYRGQPCFDGSFLASRDDYLPKQVFDKQDESNMITLDWHDDPEMTGRFFDFVRVMSKDSIWALLDQGKRYASRMERQGCFARIPK